MTGSNELFELIKSLSKTEKRYFNLFVSRHSANDNNCLKLFKFIEKQKDYDEKALRQFFKDEKFIRQLPVTKIYLYGQILKSLTLFHGDKKIETQINDLVLKSQIL